MLRGGLVAGIALALGGIASALAGPAAAGSGLTMAGGSDAQRREILLLFRDRGGFICQFCETVVPDCAPPTNLTASNITSSSAMRSFNSPKLAPSDQSGTKETLSAPRVCGIIGKWQWVDIEGSRILNGISLTVGAGELVCLVGRNGAGKTTTFRSIMGYRRAQSGGIDFAVRHRQDGAPGGELPSDRVLLGLAGHQARFESEGQNLSQ
jgi:ABC-type multidrug transport system fused ATPase/permease subunit